MTKQLTFLNSPDGSWYIDLPEYEEMGGNRNDLQMVLGADKFLDDLANEKDKVILLIATKIEEVAAKGKESPAFVKDGWNWLSKASWIPTFDGSYYTDGLRYIWLCPVTEFVFGNYPDIIYYKKVKDETKKVQTQEDGPDF